MKVRVVAVTLSAFALMVAGTQQAIAGNLLTNPGFETAPFVDDGSGVGKWQPFADGSMGNTSEIGSLMPRTGANAAELNLVNANGFAGFFQDIPAVPGFDAEWSVWAKDALGGGGAAIEMRIEYRDSVANSEVSRTGNLVPTLTTDYELVTLTDTVPAGADTARVVFAVQSFGAAPPISVYVDDAFATAPEPTTAVMAGLAGLALAARRRS
ncbi:MAG: hypothetical protein AAF266_00350 [Planctomycetota bacterium]